MIILNEQKKYEKIGSWDVSLKIPLGVRDILRKQFADYENI